MSENQEQKLGQRTYGGCEGPESQFIKLISSDGFEFIIQREHAFVSTVIQAMLSGPGEYAETETNEVYLKGVRSSVVLDVCRYFAYKVKYTGSTEIPEFPITQGCALELLMASNFLDC